MDANIEIFVGLITDFQYVACVIVEDYRHIEEKETKDIERNLYYV